MGRLAQWRRTRPPTRRTTATRLRWPRSTTWGRRCCRSCCSGARGAVTPEPRLLAHPAAPHAGRQQHAMHGQPEPVQRLRQRMRHAPAAQPGAQGRHGRRAQHVERVVHAQVDARPRHRHAEQRQQHTHGPQACVPHQAERHRPQRGQVVAGERRIRCVRQQIGAQADRKRSGVIPRQPERNVDRQRQRGRHAGLQGLASRGGLAPQPAGHERERHQPDRVFGKGHRQPDGGGRSVGRRVDPEKQRVIE
ncbi:hypothetical protein COLO4_02104 [Corchorus olitorius]|uniref:Uncharacterized protein n=1 Tax=Corchorus olitorius TaxID=93759 RepID=A0A1R3L1H0_9ROSI|nr:hypothetical protein COLO4_02104 [Corchorus olitorius]